MKIEDYVELQLHYCENSPNKVFMANAYGALTWEIIRDNTPKPELEQLWTEKYFPLFEELIYGEK